jgi:hypothetical protein
MGNKGVDVTQDLKPARQCADCSMCCKILKITSLEKPRFDWCSKCLIGRGCSAYDARPEECRTFECMWLYDKNLPEAFRPNKCHFVMYTHHAGYFIVECDRHVRNIHTNKKYEKYFRDISRKLEPSGRFVAVCYGEDVFAITPGKVYDLGATRFTHDVKVVSNNRRIENIYLEAKATAPEDREARP